MSTLSGNKTEQLSWEKKIRYDDEINYEPGNKMKDMKCMIYMM